MGDTARHVQLLVPMFWLGMVVAISFLETPLKFRAPGMSLAIGLGVGRLVFRALNAVEGLLALTLLASCVVLHPGSTEWVLLGATTAVLIVQVAVIRPPLTRRSDAVLAGYHPPRSRLHLAYIGFEVLKVALLASLAVALLKAT